MRRVDETGKAETGKAEPGRTVHAPAFLAIDDEQTQPGAPIIEHSVIPVKRLLDAGLRGVVDFTVSESLTIRPASPYMRFSSAISPTGEVRLHSTIESGRSSESSGNLILTGKLTGTDEDAGIAVESFLLKSMRLCPGVYLSARTVPVISQTACGGIGELHSAQTSAIQAMAEVARACHQNDVGRAHDLYRKTLSLWHRLDGLEDRYKLSGRAITTRSKRKTLKL